MNQQLCGEFSKLSANMQSLAARLENQAHLTSRDTASSIKGVHCVLRRIDLTLESMSKSLVVLHDRIDNIAAKVEIFSNTVERLKEEHPQEFQPEMKSPVISWSQFVEENEDWLNSLIEDPVLTTSPDIHCYETIYPQPGPLIDLTLESSGSTALQVQVSPERPIKKFQKRISRNPGPSGGMDTNSKPK